MQSRDFVFWLQGFFELTEGNKTLTPYQVELIKTHLDLVFKHDPSIPRKQMEHYKPSLPITVPDWPGPYTPGTPLDYDKVVFTC